LCLSARNRRKWIGQKFLLGLGAPDSVRQTSLGEQATLETRRQRTTIIHRTVRWCTGLSGESSAAKSSLSGKVQRRTAKIHRTVRWCTGLSGEPTVDCTNGRPRNLCATRGRANGRQGAPDSVRCANCRESTTVDCANLGRRSAPDCLQGLSGGASDCPVRHPTEGKISLPRLPPTTPSCLGAIKGTPRRMEETPKHTLSNLSLPHSVSAHLIDRVSDLSSILVVNSLCFILSSSLGLCACVLLQICVCCFPSLL
jgi:hypothetical protein